MSVYENYDETSRHYDATRRAVGAEIILGCLAQHEKPLPELTVLDAGCGTGAYARAIIDRVGRVEAIDLSVGMLAAARAKLRPHARAGRIGFCRASITELPFAAAAFDAVMTNQVVHHLGDGAEDGFARLRRVIAEFVRVLRPKGIVVFNHCAQAQLRDGYWYAHLIPQAAARFRRRYVPLETLRELLAAAGFVDGGSFVPTDALCQGEAYFDPRGPLSAAWRAGDSLWSLATEGELAAAMAKVRQLYAAGRLDDFVAEHDARRREIGQITFVYAIRA